MSIGAGPAGLDIADAAGERFLFSGRLKIVGGWGRSRLSRRFLPHLAFEFAHSIQPFTKLEVSKRPKRTDHS